MLEGNLLGEGTGGGIIGVNPETGEALVSITVLLRDLDGAVLAETLDEFVDIVEHWRDAWQEHARDGYVTINDDRIELTREGLLRADGLLPPQTTLSAMY